MERMNYISVRTTEYPQRKTGLPMLLQKMAAISKKPRSSFSDLSQITKKIYYKTTVQYLPDNMGMDIKVFEQHELCQQFYLDTSHCVTKRKHYNSKCLYDTFAELCELSGSEVKEHLIKELETNYFWYGSASSACLGMRGLTYKEWLEKLKKPHT